MKESEKNVERLFETLNEPLPSEEQMDWTAAQVLRRLKAEHTESPATVLTFTRVTIAPRGQRWLAFAVLLVFIAAGLVLIPIFRDSRHSDAYAIAETYDGRLYRLAGSETQALSRGSRIEVSQLILASGGGAVLALADGSRIEMRAESLLSVERSGDGLRINLNSGNVIVTAAKQSGGHLYLKTKDYTVSVTGTVFGVNTGSTGSRVFVIEGEVRVEQGQKLETLRPGQQMATDPTLATTPLEDALAWSRNALGHLALLQQATPITPQQSNDSASTLEGTVLRLGTSEPVPDAQVTLIVVRNVAPGGTARPSMQTIPPVSTDEHGRFLIKDIEPGSYRLVAAHNGFVRQEYGQPNDRRPGSILAIASNKSFKDLVFRLAPTGTISGRITNARNEPIANSNVQLLRAAYDINGNRTLVPAVPGVRTNDLGEYRFFWLSPGHYVVRADTSRPPQEMALRSPASGVIMSDEAQGQIGGQFNYNEVVQLNYAPTYYPGVTRTSDASVIDVQAAAQVTGIDLRLSSQQLFRVRGRMIDITTGQPSKVAAATLTPLDGFGDERPTSSYNVTTGEFEIRDVPPGSYELSVGMIAPDPTTTPSRFIRTRLEVINSNIENLILKAGPTVSLQGKILVDGLPDTSIAGFERIAVNLAGLATGNRFSRRIATDGTFNFNIPSAEYRVAVTNLPANAYVKSVRIDRTDVLHQTFMLGLTPPDTFEIVISPTAGQISGTLLDRNSEPAGIATVVLVPEDRDRRDLFKNGSTDLNGQFTFQGISPGDYKLFAWEDIEPFSYFDPDVLRGYEQQGQPIRVGESSKSTTTLKIIPISR
jgi:hypothetical protein